MDLRGAKSNVMSLLGTYRNRNCPRVALFGRMAICVHEDHWRSEKVAGISLTSSHVLGTGFPTAVMPCPRALLPALPCGRRFSRNALGGVNQQLLPHCP